jgi:hypothetical protein
MDEGNPQLSAVQRTMPGLTFNELNSPLLTNEQKCLQSGFVPESGGISVFVALQNYGHRPLVAMFRQREPFVRTSNPMKVHFISKTPVAGCVQGNLLFSAYLNGRGGSTFAAHRGPAVFLRRQRPGLGVLKSCASALTRFN